MHRESDNKIAALDTSGKCASKELSPLDYKHPIIDKSLKVTYAAYLET